jgi:hypothetical protein
MERGCRMLYNAHAELDCRRAVSRGGKVTVVVCASAMDVCEMPDVRCLWCTGRYSTKVVLATTPLADAAAQWQGQVGRTRRKNSPSATSSATSSARKCPQKIEPANTASPCKRAFECL